MILPKCPQCNKKLKYDGYIEPKGRTDKLKVYSCKVCGWRGIYGIKW